MKLLQIFPPGFFRRNKAQTNSFVGSSSVPFCISTVFANVPYQIIGNVRKDRRLLLAHFRDIGWEMPEKNELTDYFHFSGIFWPLPRAPPPEIQRVPKTFWR